MNKTILVIGGVGLVIITISLILITTTLSQIQATSVDSLGSTQQGSEYQATSTKDYTGIQIGVANTRVISSRAVTLGSVVITGAEAGTFTLYDATTTDITKRAAAKSTSSIQVAIFPVSATAGTYTFDKVLFDGLIIATSGPMPTSTITYR